jgi:hypothetical protein
MLEVDVGDNVAGSHDIDIFCQSMERAFEMGNSGFVGYYVYKWVNRMRLVVSYYVLLRVRGNVRGGVFAKDVKRRLEGFGDGAMGVISVESVEDAARFLKTSSRDVRGSCPDLSKVVVELGGDMGVR